MSSRSTSQMNFFLIYYFFQIFSINIMGRYDKQFGRNSASLFICRVCLSANVALLYMLFHFVAKARKKLFSQIYLLSAFADTMKNFLTEQSRKALIFAAKSFYRENVKKIGEYK
ncbi:hypothetical protein TDE_1981 [Treponema denticola ATCC 35405]|uniref:Uncharacterized protein n=1 Tax=Treponema denticola (strain ATCC 35405 / DSM 14222 / CIP 103919 / JCM 8153 / KCTC 15104) TaxID=243275 RepID=Q73L84_TREDE|nr:hypothetical protein TDE_1981 [Treponema denticola ATCC 35405]